MQAGKIAACAPSLKDTYSYSCAIDEDDHSDGGIELASASARSSWSDLVNLGLKLKLGKEWLEQECKRVVITH